MNEKKYCFRYILFAFSFFSCLVSYAGQSEVTDTLHFHFTVYQVDSLIQANINNPDFVVMDVRTPGEYTPEHLEGAINRNYNGAGFDSLLNLLPRHKTYVLYCQSGGRSGNTYIKMLSMDFPHVINTLGGISAWKNAGFSTTPDLAPLNMAVSDTVVGDEPVFIGSIDTITLTITNRANDTLRFSSITSLAGTEFSTDFDTATTLEGPFDYTFSIFYTPSDTLSDSITFMIGSNGGPVQFHIRRTGKLPLVGYEELVLNLIQPTLKIYPNPFSSSAIIEFELPNPGNVEIRILNQLGQILMEDQGNYPAGKNLYFINATGFRQGLYFVRLRTEQGVAAGAVAKGK